MGRRAAQARAAVVTVFVLDEEREMKALGRVVDLVIKLLDLDLETPLGRLPFVPLRSSYQTSKKGHQYIADLRIQVPFVFYSSYQVDYSLPRSTSMY